ncbi:MurR/RpiR family transcriptional regulator [Paenalcaligenes niemegkensis]|uniref:MurR/RpiR family transcriptional regulator n=1 Tax=Paenalcaligenes niemegkensis TaxID=2895469 RepID=UPI0027E24CBC|nr:MurR/RpiR family transcriptional regulator [Paenalcaligenes niemegkensis]
MIKETSSPPATIEALTQRLQGEFAGMSPQFQVGARYLLEHPEDIATVSMRAIAVRAEVQPATLVRLAQSLGYAGWSEIKDIFVRSLRRGPKRYAEQAKAVVKSRNPRGMAEKMVAAQSLNVQLLIDLNADRLPLAVELVVKAKRVFVAGFRASYAAAFSFHYLYRLFRPSVTMLRSDAGTLEVELRTLEPGDVVVLIGFAPYSHEVVRVYEAARAANSKVLAICDSLVAPIALEADQSLLFSTDVPSFFLHQVRRLLWSRCW